MAWMSKEEREGLVKRINKSYGFRKVLITIEVLALLGFAAMTFISYYMVATGGEEVVKQWEWFIKDGETIKLTSLGIGMLVWAIAVVLLGLITLILTYSMKSPKNVTKDIKALESAPVAGRKIKRGESAFEVMSERTKVEEKKKK